MKLSVLLCIIASIFVLLYIFCNKKELFTINPYIISWQKPTDGGDPQCCGYNWQVCSDPSCANIVDEGEVANDTGNVVRAKALKLEWNTKYTIRVKANNIYGPGEWVSAELSTGDGVFSSIRVAEALGESGTIITPISAGPRNVSIWASMNQGSETPNAFKASGKVVVGRGTSVIYQQRMDLESSYDVTSKSDIFSGDFASQGIPKFTFEVGDIIFITILVWDEKGNVITEGYSEMNVTQDVPSNVSGITLSYDRS